jgi:hypothetical protein
VSEGLKNATEHGSRLPPHIAEVIYGGGSWHLPGDDSGECEGSVFHSPTPLFTDAYRLAKREWWPADYPVAAWVSAPTAILCGTCRDNVDILLQMLHAADGDLSWPVRREFGNTIRALATKGWEWFVEHRPADPEPSPTKG